MASNIGSAATITGNPQSMMIGSFSQIPYAQFTASLAPVALVGLVLTFILIALFHRDEFAGGAGLAAATPPARTHHVLMLRALINKDDILTRRSLLRRSLGLTAAGALARPRLANAAATTAEVSRRAEPYPHQRLRRQERDLVAGGTIGLDQVASPYMPSVASEAAVLTPTKGHVNVVRRCSRAWGPQSDATGHLCRAEGFDAQNPDDPLWPIGSPVSLCAIR